MERKKKAEGAKKAEGEKAAAVTEFAGQASAVDDYEANVTSSNIFHVRYWCCTIPSNAVAV